MNTATRQVLTICAFVFASLAASSPAHALVRLSSGLALCWDAMGGHVRAGARIAMWECHNRGNQQIWLDFQGDAFTATDGNRYRNAIISFTDRGFCVDPRSMSVQPAGRCAQVATRNVGGNRYTIQPRAGEDRRVPNDCVVPPTREEDGLGGERLSVVKGEPLQVIRCRDANERGHLDQFWFVEQ